MSVRQIVYRLGNIFSRLIKNRRALSILSGWIFLESALAVLIFHCRLATAAGLLLFVLPTILISEFSIHLLVKHNAGLPGFSLFTNFIYKKQVMEGFPHKDIFPNSHYYIYHPFYNFAPKPSKDLNLADIEINSMGFRGKEKDWKNPENHYIYLSGDCSFFDSHLRLADTFAYMLEEEIKRKCAREAAVLNASFVHYTILHCLNRLIVDLNRVHPHLVILSVGINDVIVFVHSKNGKVPPDYTNLYRTADEKSVFDEFQNSAIIRYSKILQLCKYLSKKKMLDFERNVETLTSAYDSDENIACSKKIFTTAYFENYLRTYIGICKTFRIPLVLSMANYKASDMKGPARSFIAYGVDEIRSVAETLAKEYSIPIFDYQKEIIRNPDMIFNKWHHTKKSNELRSKLMADFITEYLESESE